MRVGGREGRGELKLLERERCVMGGRLVKIETWFMWRG